ncbi:MAG: hypothetical protein EHM61_06820 [Acidobacteria bacterium]|nr:MAG: hypothetical protein EHM61_06820 [Acidobacteriota bacterium]
MTYKIVLACILSLVISASVMASTPVINDNLSSPTSVQTRMMDYMRLAVRATDPGHELVYEWTIVKDRSAKAYFTGTTGQPKTVSGAATTVEIAFPWISDNEQLNAPYVGDGSEPVEVVVIVKHANEEEGTETASRTFSIRLTSVNHPPVPVISGQMGTATNRVPTGSAVICTSGGSYDPDPGDSYRSDWAWAVKSGMLLGPITMIGSEGSTMSFTVPNMTTTADLEITLQLSDGMHRVRTTGMAYLKAGTTTPPPPPPGENPPVVSVTSPVTVQVGQTLLLNAVASDSEGDDLAFSWVWLQNNTSVAPSAITATPVAVTTGKKWNVQANLGPAPTAGTFQARFSATERYTTKKQSAAGTVTINVMQDGGPPGEVTITPINCLPDNPHPSVTVNPNPQTSALKYKGGQPVSITITAQDASEYVTALGKTTGATISWDLSQLGVQVEAPPFVVNQADKTISTSTLMFTAPEINGTRKIIIIAEDKLGCQTKAEFGITFEANTANQPPVPKIMYKVGSGTLQAAPTTAVSVDSPATITLDASTSTDDGGAGSLSYLWTKTDSISGGGVTLANGSTKTATLTINSNTQGSVTVTLKTTDQQGLNASTPISFTIANPSAKPTAKITVKVGNTVLTTPVEEGSTVTLDGSGSTNSDGTSNHLAYSWRQTAGSPVSLVGADTATATFAAPGVASDGTSLKFELTVTDTQSNGTAKLDATVLVNLPATYFAQIGVGPLGTDELRTGLLLVNQSAQPALGIVLEFFDSEGQPLEANIDGKVWGKQPFDIQALSSKRFVFTGTDGGATKVGWARVKANVKLTGLVQFQIVRSQNEVQREISLFSSTRGTRFATYFNPLDETALAVANPTDQPVTINVKLIDYVNGEQWVVKNSVLFPEIPGSKLAAKQHRAKFIDSNLLGQLPTNFKEGTLVVEADGEVIVTVLKTKGGVPFSALPLAHAK